MARKRTDDAAQIEKVRARCRKSLFWTAWYICEFRDISFVLHFAIAAWFHKLYDEGQRWFLLLIPRGHFKTSLMNQAFIVHRLIRDPNTTILLVMHNMDEAISKGGKIRHVIMSEPMRTYFPELVPETWNALGTQKKFSVNRTRERSEKSVTLAGVATGLVGGHYDIIIIDDGIDLKASSSEQVMQNAVNFFQAVPPLRESENTMILVIGTLWPGGEMGYYEKLLKNKLFKKVVLGCYIDDRLYEFLADVGMKLPDKGDQYTKDRVLEDNQDIAWEEGSPIFPEWRTIKSLADDLEVMGEYKFAHQMLNLMRSEGKQLFKREYFIQYHQVWKTATKQPSAISINEVLYPWPHGRVYVAMDPTGGIKKDSDTCGISAWWYHSRMRFACLLEYFEESGVKPKGQLEKIVEIGTRWNAYILIIEGGAMQVWAEEWLKHHMVEQGKTFRLHGFKTKGVAKGHRILDRVEPFAANHQLHVLYPEHEPFVDHMVNLNIDVFGEVAGQSPALADTMPMVCEWWEPGRNKEPAPRDVVRDETFAENQAKAAKKTVRYGLQRRTGRKYRYG